MNKDFMRRIGFGDMVDAVEQGFCPVCKQPVTVEGMSELERQEYHITGLCVKCQAKAFKEE